MELRDSIIQTIAWFDLFDFPLTAEEVQAYLYNYNKPLHIKEVKGILGQLLEERQIELIKDHYVLPGRAVTVETRKTRKFIAEKLWNRVKLYGQYMRNVPFVRMIAVCNNLSYNNASEQSDIDLFVVVKPGRMWIARLLITLILQFFGVRRHGNKVAGRFCLSFFVTDKKLGMEELALKPEDPYLAYWTKLLSPIYDEGAYEEFKKANENWILPAYGLKFSDNAKKHLYVEGKSGLKKTMEWILNGKLGDGIEWLLKKTFKKKTLAHAQKLGPEASVIVSDDILKFHNHDKRAEYRKKWFKAPLPLH
ncbi:hypothetical protein JXA05_00430 [Candidatus Peregrinibacteria bacterium]|nr:hypothetical protein [Candidatus Peregrinibacteria bacterium]